MTGLYHPPVSVWPILEGGVSGATNSTLANQQVKSLNIA